MKYNIELLKSDILDELVKIEQIIDEFSEIEIKLEEKNVRMYDKGAIGYYLHNFYNGCENIFVSIARFFENDIPSTSWHSDILKRMKISVNGFRPCVIDEELYLLLDDFRGFRHKFRHSYTFELDWEKEVMVAKKLKKTGALVKEQLNGFIDKLEDIENV